MPIISMVVAVQIGETLKLLTGALKDLHGSLMQLTFGKMVETNQPGCAPGRLSHL
jgi:hypothetical protein